MADYGDILLEAVQTVVDGSLEKLAFDKTVVCTITSNADADKGEYTVNDGATTFMAYSDNTSYTVGTSVYVNIPNGDFSKQKMITGKYITKKGDYYTYTSPWDNFVDITGDILPDDTPHSIKANNNIDDTNWTTDERLQEIELLAPYRILDGKDYTAIGIKADFKAMLKNTGAEVGTYGIRVYIRTVNKNGSKTGNPYKTYLAELSTMDMIGNPYAFESYYNQQKVFDISGMGELYSVRVTLFQKNDFYTASGELIQKDEKDNIFVNNIYLSLGYSIEDFNGDQVFLYTLNSESYSVDYGRFGEENQKNIKLRWVHKNDEDGSIKAYTGMADVGETARIHWYKYKLDQNINDDLAGAFWEEIFDWRDTFEQDVNLFNSVGEQNVRYKVIIETPVKEFLLRDIQTDSEVNKASTALQEARARLESAQEFYEQLPTDANQTDLNLAQSQYDDALDVYNDVTEKYVSDILSLESNTIEFTNERKVADLETLDLIQALSLNVDPDGYKGIYTLYDETNQIQNSVEARKVRTITAVYESTVTGDKDLDAAESIMWQIPLVNTMIQAPEIDKEFTEADEYAVSEDGTYCTITRNGKENAGTIGKSFEHADVQYFRIKDYFTASATNNTIYCYVTKDNKTYQASVELTFGPLGTNGTDFTFLLKMETDRTCVYGLDTDPLRIDAVLYDFNNDLVPHAQNATITYSWWAQDDITKIGFCAADGTLLDSDGKEIEEEDENLTGIKLLRNYAPEVDSVNDTHMSCWIRRLTDIEIKTLNGLDVIDTSTDRIPFFYIMEANIKIDALSTTKNLGKVILNSYLPIPYAANYQYTQIEGADRVIYNSAGTGRIYYENNYILYNGNEVISDTIWGEANGADTLEELKFYPVVEDDGRLVPSATYVDGLSRQVAAVAYEDLGNKQKGTIRWTQPIAILQNAYSSAMLNAWDGSLTIDEENNTIMSAMVGAGYKDEYNRFNGVLMGDVRSKADTAADTGLFGYSEGVQSFGFKTDGTAFLGKSGKGQIQFDGASGIIQSMSYAQGRTGMKIDLDDGVIEMRGNEIETVENVKNVDIVALADFASALNDVYYYVGEEKIKASENTELYNAMNVLHNYNGKGVKEMTEAEILQAQTALNYIRKTVNAIEFSSNSLQNYLALKREEYFNAIVDANETIYTNEKVIKTLKSTTADQEDKEKLKQINEELSQEIAKYRTLIKEIDNYNNVVADIETYKTISALIQQYNEAQSQLKAAQKQEEELTDEIAKETSRKVTVTTRKNAAYTKWNNYSASTSASTDAETILNAKAKSDVKQLLYNEYEELKDEEAQITAAITALNTQLTNVKKQTDSTNGTLVKQVELLKSQVEAAKEVLKIQKVASEDSSLNYEAIIDVTDILEATGGDASSDAYKQAVQEAYFELLSSTDVTSILPTQLVNSTTTTPTYKKTKAQVRLATVSPYLQLIDSKGNSLLEASDKRYYLQSSGYEDSLNIDGSGGKGVKFDLLDGKITGYNFSFKSALSDFMDVDAEAAKYNGSYISFSSLGTNTNPFFRVHYTLRDSTGANVLSNINLLDITRSNFVMHSQDWNGSDTGLELNLTEGKLRAFSGFDLRAGDDETYIRLSDSGSPYLQIVQENKKLMNISTRSFVLQSLDWEEESSGMQIDLTKGRIKSFSDFDLKTTITSGAYAESYIRLGTSSTAFAFVINYQDTDEQPSGLKLLEITHNKFKMHSHDWNNTAGKESGVQFNMETGKITAYKFTVKAYRDLDTIDTAQYVSLDSTAKTYPFRIEGKDDDGNNKYFRVRWTGQADLNYINAIEGKIGPFYITSSKMYTGSDQFKGSGIYMDSFGNASFNGSTYIGNTLEVSGTTAIDGKTTINDTLTVGANTAINGTLTVNGKTYLNGDLYIAGSISGVNWGADSGTAGSYSAGSGGILSAGNIQADGGKIGNWVIDKGTLRDEKSTIILDPDNASITFKGRGKIKELAGNLALASEDGNSKFNISNSGATIYGTSSSSYVFVGGTGTIISNKLTVGVQVSNGTVNGGDITFYGNLNPGSYTGVSSFELKKPSSASGSGTTLLKFSKGVLVETSSSSSFTLGKLAFADDVKKNISVTKSDTIRVQVTGTKTEEKYVTYSYPRVTPGLLPGYRGGYETYYAYYDNGSIMWSTTAPTGYAYSAICAVNSTDGQYSQGGQYEDFTFDIDVKLNIPVTYNGSYRNVTFEASDEVSSEYEDISSNGLSTNKISIDGDITTTRYAASYEQVEI